jgi:hypothetical protein
MKEIAFSMKDFTQVNFGVWNDYILNKDCIIFSKPFKKEQFELTVRGIDKVSEYISKIDDYLKWLSGRCKNELINTFCEIISSLDENINITPDQIIESNWYEELKIYNVILFLSEGGTLCARISCIDNYKKNSILEINTEEQYIDIKYDEARLYKLHKIPEEDELVKSLNNEKNVDKYTNNNKIREKNSLCKIHNFIMKKKKIPIMYGLPIGPIVGYTEDREKLFPNCDDEIIGGCEIDENKSFKLKYICNLCNKTRDEWKNKHRSEIFFHLERNIRENVIIVLNDIQFIIKKTNAFENYWVKIISIPNGKYKILARNKTTKENIASIEVELNNEYVNLCLENNMNNNIIFRIEYINKITALWY